MIGNLIRQLFGGGGDSGSIVGNVPDNTVPSGFTPGNSDVPPATSWTSGSDLPSGLDFGNDGGFDLSSILATGGMGIDTGAQDIMDIIGGIGA